MNRILLKHYLEWCCLITYSTILGFYAFAKAIQFENRLKIATPVNELSPFRLMWAFYGYSTTYPIIIGIFQLLSIILIIARKTRLFGCILGTIILSNIILQDIIYAVPEGALFNAIFLQLLIVIIIYFNKKEYFQKMKSLLSIENSPNYKHIEVKQKIKNLAISILIFIAFTFLLLGIWTAIHLKY